MASHKLGAMKCVYYLYLQNSIVWQLLNCILSPSLYSTLLNGMGFRSLLFQEVEYDRPVTKFWRKHFALYHHRLASACMHSFHGLCFSDLIMLHTTLWFGGKTIQYFILTSRLVASSYCPLIHLHEQSSSGLLSVQRSDRLSPPCVFMQCDAWHFSLQM